MFEFIGIYCGILHHGMWELIHLSNDVIGKEEFSAVKFVSVVTKLNFHIGYVQLLRFQLAQPHSFT